MVLTPTIDHCLNDNKTISYSNAKDLSIEVHEKDLRYEDFKNADEVYSTAVEITPITKLDQSSINDGKRDLLQKFLDSFMNIFGKISIIQTG